MKQHISAAEINELTDAQKEKLREWWEPEEGDWVCIAPGTEAYLYEERDDSERVIVGCLGTLELGHSDYGKPHEGTVIKEAYYTADAYRNIDIQGCLPLLSIGQMIELLHDSEQWVSIQRDLDEFHPEGPYSRYVVGTYETEDYRRHELCDALWEVVKEAL